MVVHLKINSTINRLKRKKVKVNSLKAEKVFDIIPQTFMINHSANKELNGSFSG